MKVLVFSDSHGDVKNMCRAIAREQPRMVLHLGDGWHDAEAVAERFPELPLEKVPGNCDFRYQEEAVRLVLIEGKLVMLSHGHTLGVKNNLSILLREAQARGADVALLGHTHKPFVDIRNGVTMLNPGSIGDYQRPTYGTLTFENGQCIAATHVLEIRKLL